MICSRCACEVLKHGATEGQAAGRVHPSQLPDGPERDAWLEAEADYASKHDPIWLPLKENDMCGVKVPRRLWLRQACAWMMK